MFSSFHKDHDHRKSMITDRIIATGKNHLCNFAENYPVIIDELCRLDTINNDNDIAAIRHLIQTVHPKQSVSEAVQHAIEAQKIEEYSFL